MTVLFQEDGVRRLILDSDVTISSWEIAGLKKGFGSTIKKESGGMSGGVERVRLSPGNRMVLDGRSWCGW